MTSIPFDAPHVRRDTVFDATIRDEAVLLDLETDGYFALDEVGARVWALLAQPGSVRQVCKALAGEYAVEPDEVMDQVAALFGSLRDHGLITTLTDQKVAPEQDRA